MSQTNSTDAFYLVSSDGLRALRCQPVASSDYDYETDLFVHKDEKVYRSEWKTLQKDHVTAFLDSGWELSKINPLSAVALSN
jgi:hypothetical protein